MGARKEDERQPMTFAPGCELVEKYIFLIGNDWQKRDRVKVFWIIVFRLRDRVEDHTNPSRVARSFFANSYVISIVCFYLHSIVMKYIS